MKKELLYIKFFLSICIIFHLYSLSAKNVTNDEKKIYIDEQIRFADGLIQREHFDLAIDEYNRLIKKFPDSELAAEAWLQLAEAYAAKKDYQNAFATFDQFFTKFPEIRIIPAAKLRYALVLNKTTVDNKQKAIEMLNQLKTEKNTPEIIVEASIYHLGKIHLNNNDKTKAEGEFKLIAGKKVTEKSHNFRAFAAMELAEMKSAEEAIALLMPMADSTSLPPELLNTVIWKLANLLYEKQQFDKAANLFAKESILFPDTATGQESRFRRFESLYRMKEFDKVVSETDQILKNNEIKDQRSIERLLYMKALALKQLKFYQQAVKTLLTVLTSGKNPKITPLAAFTYIDCLLAENQQQQAIRDTENFITKKFVPTETIKDIVLLIINSSGNDIKLIPLLQKALAIGKKGSSPETAMQLKLATLLVKQNKLADAEKIYKEQIENGFEQLKPYASMGLAQVYEIQNKNQLAVSTYRDVLKKFTKSQVYPDAMLRLAVVLLQDREQWETAKLYLAQLADRFPDNPIVNSANFYLAYMMFYDKQYTVAASMLQSIEKNKDLSNELEADIKIYLTWIYLKTKQIDKALNILNDKTNGNMLKRAPAQFLLELGKKTAADHPAVSQKAFLLLAESNDPKEQQQALIGLANAQIAIGDPVKAIDSLKKAEELKADPILTSSAQTKLGILLFERGKKNEAVMVFERCLENPADKDASSLARLGLARILSEDKDRLKTANRYAMSVFILSSDKTICSEAMLLSIKISMNMGNKKEAESTWKEFSTRFPDLAKDQPAVKIKEALDKMP